MCDLLSMFSVHLFIEVFVILIYLIKEALGFEEVGDLVTKLQATLRPESWHTICKDLMYTQQRILQRSTDKIHSIENSFSCV